MSVTGYSYPWDYVGDDDAAARVAALGLNAVALSSTYHGTRLATRLHPTRFVTEIPHSAAYFSLREEVWGTRRLRPSAPVDWIGDASFERASAQLRERGLSVLGWIVLSHDDQPDARHRELCVRNARGDVYSYALCPSHDEVRDYCRTLALETLHSTPLSGVVLEACGPLGVEHASLHDKTYLAGFSEVERALLSICFCGACRDEFAARRTRSRRDRRARARRAGQWCSLGRGRVGRSLRSRRRVSSSRAPSGSRANSLPLFDETHPEVAITLHASADPWATGSFAPSDASVLGATDAAVANCWGDEDHALRQLAALRPLTSTLGAYVRLDDGAEKLVSLLARSAALGLDELHLYHLGLLTPEGHTVVARLLEYWTSLTSEREMAGER